MPKKVLKSRQVRIMDMSQEQLMKLIERRKKQLDFARALLATKFPLFAGFPKEG